MEARFKLKPIWKSNDPEKLIVFKACSLEHEIRFYLNKDQYIVASENHDGTFYVHCGENQKIKKSKGSTLTYIRKNIKDKKCLKFLVLALFIISLIAILMSFLIISFINISANSPYILLMFINFLFFSTQVILVMISEYKTATSLKSKHSAEHMMAEFLENNKRLPKTMEEIKKMSRFSVNCGTRKKIQSATADFISSIFGVSIGAGITYCVTRDITNKILVACIFLAIYYVTNYVIGILIYKYNKLKFIINPIINVLNNIIQHLNTTKEVREKDIQLAYFPAKYWLQIVYPEFYNEEDDILYNCEEVSN